MVRLVPGPALGAALALALLAVVPGLAVAASSGFASFSYTGTSQYEGVATAACGAVLLEPAPEAAHGITAAHRSATLVVVETETLGEDVADLPGHNAVAAEPQARTTLTLQGPVRIGWDLGAGAAAWRMHGFPFAEASGASDPVRASLDAPLLLADGFVPVQDWSPLTIWRTGTDGTVQPLPLHFGLPFSARRVWAPDLDADLTGAATLYLRDAWIEHGPGRVETGPYHESPDGLRHSYREALIHFQGLDARDVPLASAYCTDLDAHVDGRILVDDGQGTYETGPEAGALGPGRLTLQGRLHAVETFSRASATGAGESTSRVDGEFRGLAVDVRRVAGEASHAGVAAWSLAGAVAAAAGILVWRLPDLAQFWLRVRGQGPLDHPRRRLLMDAIRGRPGSDLRDLARMTGMAAGVLRHHLAVLHRARHVEGFRHGRSYRLVPVEGGRAERRARVLVARDPRYAFLLEALGAAPAPQAHLEEALAQRFGVARRSARKIIHAAQAHGLVVRERGPAGVMVRCPPTA